MTIGIYAIRCRPSANSYVGSSVQVEIRWQIHKCELRKGTHHCTALQHAWNKHGEEAFELVVLEHCARSDLLRREQHFIDLLDPAYNSARVVNSPSELNRSIARTHMLRLNQLPWTKERRDKARARAIKYKLGGPASDAAREKMSASAKRRKAAEKAAGISGPWALRGAKL